MPNKGIMERKETKKQLPIFQFFLLYLQRMETPKAVIKAAYTLIQGFGSKFKHLGEYEGQDAWLFVMPADTYTGFPHIFLYKDDSAVEMCGPEALPILHSFDIE
jgi:hypothetical protein